MLKTFKIQRMKKLMATFGLMVFAVVITGCSGAKGGNSKNLITSTAWELSSINGSVINASDYDRGIPDAAFGTDGRVNGLNGCNRYGGTYTIEDNGKLTLGQMMSTKMFCPGEGEGMFMKALHEANMVKVEKEKLVLLNGTKEVLVFVPKKAN